jgi:hypothetical protein
MACRAGVGRITATMTTKPRARASKVSGTIAAPRVTNMPRTLIGSADQALGAGRLRGAVAEVESSGRQSVLLDARSHRPSIGVRGWTLRAPSVRSGWGSVCSAVLYNAIQHSQRPPGSRVTPLYACSERPLCSSAPLRAVSECDSHENSLHTAPGSAMFEGRPPHIGAEKPTSGCGFPHRAPGAGESATVRLPAETVYPSGIAAPWLGPAAAP